MLVILLLRPSVINIEWDYSYYQPWSDNEWLVDKMLVLLCHDLAKQLSHYLYFLSFFFSFLTTQGKSTRKYHITKGHRSLGHSHIIDDIT